MNIYEIRDQYPILNRKIDGKPLVYLDNAATSQTPRCVVETINDMYFNHKSNVHRGVHTISQEATNIMEATREKVRQFINAKSTSEIVFTRGTTEAINLVASSYGDSLFTGDEIVLTVMEHHSNIVPWQLLQRNKRLKIHVVPIDNNGNLDMNAYEDLFTENIRFVAVTHVSNVLGTINPVKEMVQIAHRYGVPVLIDGAQAAPHMKIDVQDLDADFYCFSSHKMYGPAGIGVLYGKEKMLNRMVPYQGGGEMIGNVTFEKTTFAELPFKFEAGTPAVGDVLGLGTAIDFISQIGIGTIAATEKELTDYATGQLQQIEGLRIYGTAPDKTSVISFLIGNAHPYDVGTLLDKLGIAVRTGHHCTQPIMDRYGIPGTVRASFAVYNTRDEVDTICAAIRRIAPMLQ